MTVLTTAAPPQSGINWVAAIFANYPLEVFPRIGFGIVPDYQFNIAVTPSLGFLPPLSFNLLFVPSITMNQGSEETAAFKLTFPTSIRKWTVVEPPNIRVTPSIGMTGGGKSVGAFNLHPTPSIGMVGGGKSVGAFNLHLTPSIGMAGVLTPRGQQLNYAVMRSSTR